MMLTTLRRSPARRSAFTLLEVLVVVAILVILATVATIATTRYIEEAKKTKAQLGCVTLDKSIKAYHASPSNPGILDEEKLPSGPQDLLRPFGSSSSMLEGGQNDLMDPWGKEYQFERRNRPDGSAYIVVFTVAPDGTRISQYGVGPNSEPRLQQ
jgi:general secretion pathway protein G